MFQALRYTGERIFVTVVQLVAKGESKTGALRPVNDGRVCDTAPRCFARRGQPAEAAVPLDIALDDDAARALATLVPLLGCGEEAAALAFDGLSQTSRDDAEHYALQAIAHEERAHDALLTRLAASLPAIDAVAIRRRARRFHVALGRGDRTHHLARIAAVDAGVCVILSRLLRAGTPVSRDAQVAALLGRIHRDEARHVSMSRQFAAAGNRNVRQTAAAARVALADVLTIGADAFETLAVDPSRLLADIRRMPNGLFAT
jgi:hypothetical protein